MKNILVPLTSLALAATAFGQIAVTEYQSNPFDSQNHEYIEFFNYSDTTVDLSGWTLSDTAGLAHTFSGTLASGEYYVLTRLKATANPSVSTFETEWSALGNFDQVDQGNGAFNLANGTENITLTNGSFTWSIANIGVNSQGTAIVLDDAFDFNTISGDVIMANDSQYENAVAGIHGAFSSTNSNIGSPLTGSYSPVPEPQTFALIAGLLAISSVATRRRK